MQRHYPTLDSIVRHRHAATLHAMRRASQRLHVRLQYFDVQEHSRLVASGRSKVVGTNAGRELHLIEKDGNFFYAVWCPSIRHIVTYLSGVEQWRGVLIDSVSRKVEVCHG